MKKHITQIIFVIFALVMLLSIVPVIAYAGGGCYVNAAYSRVTCNADDGSMPSSVKTFYYGETTFINLQCGNSYYIRSAKYHLSKDGVSDYKTDTIYPQNDYIRYCSTGWDKLPVGSYTLYWTITYSYSSYSSSITTKNTSSYSFSVIDRTPSINVSSNSVSLNLAGTNSKTINIWKSCDLSYQCKYQWNKSSSDFSCEWGEWTDGKLPLTITGKNTCSNETITIKLLKSSDDSVVATKTVYVTVSTEKYTVKYNANGGSGAPSDQTKEYNKNLTLSSTVPTRTGYNFLGWSTSSTATSASYSPNGIYSNNYGTTLYAVWQQKTLSLGSNDRATISRSNQEYFFKFTPSTSHNYVFYSTGSSDTKGFLYDSSGSLIASDDDGGNSSNFRIQRFLSAGSTYYFGVKYYNSSTTGNISISFGPVYAIKYNANGGSGAPSDQNKDWGVDITVSSTTPTRTGYNFSGWSTSNSATTATYSPGSTISTNENKTLYAVWQYHTHNYKTSVTNATCSSQGYTLYTCTICSYSYKSNYTSKLSHKFDDWTIVKAPTEEVNGTGKRICSVCHTAENIELAFKEDENSKVQLMYPYKPNMTIVVKDETQTIGDIIQNGQKTHKLYDITMLKDNQPIQPDGMVNVRIPVPSNFDVSKAHVYHLKSRNPLVREEIASHIEGNDKEGYYIVFRTNHFSYFEITEEVGKVNSVSISNLSLNYKASSTLKPTVNAEEGTKYTIEYSSSDANVATVDKNGKVYAAGTGNATITCTVTDSWGNVVADTCKVTVGYAWWQWIIIIVLFGWIWY